MWKMTDAMVASTQTIPDKQNRFVDQIKILKLYG